MGADDLDLSFYTDGIIDHGTFIDRSISSTIHITFTIILTQYKILFLQLLEYIVRLARALQDYYVQANRLQ